MLQRTLLAVFAILFLAAASAPAQTETAPAPGSERVFSLKHAKVDTTARAAAPKEELAQRRYAPRIETGKLEIGMSLGFLDLNQTLIDNAKKLIYKRTDEFTYFGDVRLVGEAAFNPVLRITYNLTPWLGLETANGISVSEYTSQIDSTVAFSNEIGSEVRVDNPPLGEFDAEHRSCITLSSSLNAVVYPLNVGKGAEGRISRWQPYVTGGLGRTWYSLNSNYTDKTAGAWNVCAGGGLRLIADDLISIRIEALYNRSRVEFEPAPDYLVLDEGTLKIPIEEWALGQAREPVSSFTAHTLSSLSWSVGFTASF